MDFFSPNVSEFFNSTQSLVKLFSPGDRTSMAVGRIGIKYIPYRKLEDLFSVFQNGLAFLRLTVIGPAKILQFLQSSMVNVLMWSKR